MARYRRKYWPENLSGWSRQSALLVGGCALLLAAAATVIVVAVLAQQRARLVTVSGATINVKAGGSLQAALDRANPGDTILLEAGATFTGPFNLPNKSGANFITIRTESMDTAMPQAGERIDPARCAVQLAKLAPGTQGVPTLMTAPSAHHYRFIAVEFGPTPTGAGNIIQIGSTEEPSAAELPHHIEFDRVYIHGSKTEGQRRGIAANGRAIRIVNSYISEIKRTGEESQAIAAWSSDGPFEISNNYLEAAGEGILFGGATGRLGLTPSDIVVRDNWFNKQVAWRTQSWVVKNHLELKHARRVRIENNLMTNNWAAGQNGTAVLFTTRIDSGPQVTIEDVVFAGNIVKGSSGALNVYGSEGKGGHALTIRNNLFLDISGKSWGGNGQFLTVSEWDGLLIENNTIINDGNITRAYGPPVTRFVFRNNVVFNNEYGFAGENHAPGLDSLDTFFPGSIVSNNAIIGGDASRMPGRNMYPPALLQLQFLNPGADDFRLQANSVLRGKGSDGTDIGANLSSSVVGVAGGARP